MPVTATLAELDGPCFIVTKSAREAVPSLAPAVETISAYEGMSVHGPSATRRLPTCR